MYHDSCLSVAALTTVLAALGFHETEDIVQVLLNASIGQWMSLACGALKLSHCICKPTCDMQKALSRLYPYSACLLSSLQGVAPHNVQLRFLNHLTSLAEEVTHAPADRQAFGIGDVVYAC